MRTPRTSTFLIVFALLTIAPMSGCLTDDGGDGGAPPAMTESEARAAFTQALSTLESPPDAEEAPAKLSMRVEAQAVNATEPQSFAMGGYLDTDAGILIFDMSMESTGSEDEGGFFTMPSNLTFAQVGRTSIVGSNGTFTSAYNDSAEPPTSLNALEDEEDQAPGSTGSGFPNPADLLDEVREAEATGNATLTHEPTTYEGKDAVRIHVTFDNGTESGELTAMVWLEPTTLPAYIELEARNATAEDPLQRHATIRFDFGYGDTATHPDLQALLRLEALTYMAEEDTTMMGGEDGPTEHTIQPSINPGLVPLEDVTLRATNGSSSEDGGAVLELPLEEGTTANAHVRLTYTDVDDDGHVSPGDTLKLEPLSDDGDQWTLSLHDEVTGYTIPGPGVLLALLGVAGAALTRRRAA